MTSFPVEIDPPPLPRLAAALVLLHLGAAAWPWLSRCTPWLAAGLSALAVASLAATLAWLPGPHCRLRRLCLRGDVWRAGLPGEAREVTAQIGPGTRVYPGLIVLELRVAGRRLGWLLPRAALGGADFRRLKARLRMSC